MTETPPTRRQVAAGMTLGTMVAAISGGASAQTNAAPAPGAVTPTNTPKPEVVANVGTAPALTNPLTEYPKPPFPPQVQPSPGLQINMNPRPDCGERSYKGSGRLAGRRALITGGDSGIGRAAAIAFAREGADVAICHLPVEEPDAAEVVEWIQRAGRKGFSIPGDIREEAFCNQLVAQAVQQLGGLDILVSNAGHQESRASILDISTEQFDTTFKTNVYAMFWITKAAVPHLPPGAAIINTTSVNAYDPGETLLDYASTKGAIMIFTKALAKQLMPKGIRVNGVAPGPFWTPLQISGGQPESALATFGAQTLLGRPGQPAEIAPVYVALAEPGNSYATGQIYGATGGRGGP